MNILDDSKIKQFISDEEILKWGEKVKDFSNFKIADGKIRLKLVANQSVKIIIE